MDIQSIFSLNTPTIVFILGCIIILIGLVGILLLALRREINSLVSISVFIIILGLFLVIVDRILVHYVDYGWLNKIEIIGIVLLGVLYVLQNWEKIKELNNGQ
jgi:hypothetical protein